MIDRQSADILFDDRLSADILSAKSQLDATTRVNAAKQWLNVIIHTCLVDSPILNDLKPDLAWIQGYCHSISRSRSRYGLKDDQG